LVKKKRKYARKYQVDKAPIMEIPLYKPTDSEANKIATLVDKIIIQKEQGKSSKDNETKIDELVYKLYELTSEEIKIIEQ